MSQGFYLEETSYRLVEQLLFATQDLAAKIEVLTQQLVGHIENFYDYRRSEKSHGSSLPDGGVCPTSPEIRHEAGSA